MSDLNLVKTELISRGGGSNEDINQIVNPIQIPISTPNQGQSNAVETNGGINSVSVSIEPNHQSEIYEIRFDGTEVYKE